jgi:rSAM/selenodomain-associated transferase 1
MDQRLLIFAKCPVPGKVKTRLVTALGIEGATQLYTRLFARTLDLGLRLIDADLEVWLDPAVQAPGCPELLARYAVDAHSQCDGDLGRRMHQALESALRVAKKAVLIGTDCPDMNTQVLDQAFAALDHADVVLGPAFDGGYVLIGARKIDPLLFDDIPWGSDRVMAETRARLDRLGWVWQELAPLQDIDDPEDLGHPFIQSILH